MVRGANKLTPKWSHDSRIDDHRLEHQRLKRKASAAPATKVHDGIKIMASQSATMDAFIRIMTGKEERTIADRISDPNRPTWEQYKKENLDKLDLSGDEEKKMKEYRKKLDAVRDKKLAGVSGFKKRMKPYRKRPRSSSSDVEDVAVRSRIGRSRTVRQHKYRRIKKRHKHRRKSEGSDDSDTD
ncbi:uncharacterized protein PHALS_12561 [Plasmopara halstedii]|uniref:Uncharacterized protein n=1 Tax=Plasmopara halstedii TaxID=4781 RepID=A0A0P1AM74_PLAHL|nr:uncharacterized protein PHALS_12561 [Plasmopara halstedii]CEG42272.1 hypothetical protein PHALS_12561 [Plasmopara halstedii]|eukprot:XP_024578641.1 hypothetical protein PHALS_12561 [Plasmopara halstedii]